MVPFERVEREQLFVVNELNDIEVVEALSKGLSTIYIEKNGELLGCVFLKNQLKTGNGIRYNFKEILQEGYSELEVENIFDNNKVLEYIPIVDNGKLIGEVKRKYIKKENIYNLYWSVIDEVYYNLLIKKARVLVVGDDEEAKQLAQKLERCKCKVDHMTEYNRTNILSKKKRYDWIIFKTQGFQRYCIERNRTKFITFGEFYYRVVQLSIMDYYKRHNIAYYYIVVPTLDEIPADLKDDFYQFLLNDIAHDKKALDKFYGNDVNRKFWEDGDYKRVAIVKNGISTCLKDSKSKNYNVIDGKRLTVQIPNKYISVIHCFGPCIVRGGAVNDASTICSYLQQKINEVRKDWIKVINYGTGGEYDSIFDLHRMMIQQYAEEDIVLHFGPNKYDDKTKKTYNIKTIELLKVFLEKKCWTSCFINSCFHINHIANQIISEYIFNKIVDGSNFTIEKRGKEKVLNTKALVIHQKIIVREIEQFKEELLKYKYKSSEKLKIGAIVMNCNPFTLGHLYLVKEALKIIDYLYIFIVEEDKSYFTFKDRLALAKTICREYSNVTVIPSSRFIISTLTFPEYFFKEELKEVEIDPSKDIKLFAEQIAPILDISYRFVGEEPIDKVTAQYNIFLKDILKQYNINVIEIPRKCIGETYISASKVRELIEHRELNEIKNYVPLATYNLIVKMVKEKSK